MHVDQTASSIAEKNIVYSYLHSPLQVLFIRVVGKVALGNHVSVRRFDGEQAHISTRLGLQRVKFCLLLTNLVLCHDFLHADALLRLGKPYLAGFQLLRVFNRSYF